jgi:hypothetical protein
MYENGILKYIKNYKRKTTGSRYKKQKTFLQKEYWGVTKFYHLNLQRDPRQFIMGTFNKFLKTKRK